jgi:hypothetical protein
MLFITIFLRNTFMYKCVKIKFHLKRIVIISTVACMYLYVECWTYHWIKTVMIEVHYISIHVFQSCSTVSQLTIYLYKYFIMKNNKKIKIKFSIFIIFYVFFNRFWSFLNDFMIFYANFDRKYIRKRSKMIKNDQNRSKNNKKDQKVFKKIKNDKIMW